METKPKANLNLALKDFYEYPIWTFYDDDFDEDRVVPVLLSKNVLPKEEEDRLVSIFVLSELTLKDKKKMEGVVYISLTDRLPFYLEFFRDDSEFGYSGRLISKTGTMSQLEMWLSKPKSSITPVKYDTPFKFSDGTNISGTIDLLEW